MPEPVNGESWYEMLDRAKALGGEYAANGIAAGERMPQESPLSGEWDGAITPKDVVRQLGGNPDTLEDFELSDICDAWEDGYWQEAWPERPSED